MGRHGRHPRGRNGCGWDLRRAPRRRARVHEVDARPVSETGRRRAAAPREAGRVTAAILRPLADVAQLVERLLAMQKVDGSSPFIRLQSPRSAGVFVVSMETCVPNVSPLGRPSQRLGHLHPSKNDLSSRLTSAHAPTYSPKTVSWVRPVSAGRFTPWSGNSSVVAVRTAARPALLAGRLRACLSAGERHHVSQPVCAFVYRSLATPVSVRWRLPVQDVRDLGALAMRPSLRSTYECRQGQLFSDLTMLPAHASRPTLNTWVAALAGS